MPRPRSSRRAVEASTSSAAMLNLSRSSTCHCSARCGGHSTASRWALALVEQLARDQRRLDRLADPDIIRDQQPDRILAAAPSTAAPAGTDAVRRRSARSCETGRRSNGTPAAERHAAAAALRASPGCVGSGGANRAGLTSSRAGRIPAISASVAPSGRSTSRSGRSMTRAGRPTRDREREPASRPQTRRRPSAQLG